jgi:hypothetical protein
MAKRQNRNVVPVVPVVPVDVVPVDVPVDVVPVDIIVTALSGTVTVRTTSPDGVHVDIPVTPTIARVVMAVRASASIPDGVDAWDARIVAVRAAYDVANGSPVKWDAIPANTSPFGARIMDTQNAIMYAMVVSGVKMSERAVCAVWRGLLPVTKSDFGTKPYGMSSLGDMGTTRRPMAVPTIPDNIGSRVIVAWRTANGPRKPWTVSAVPVTE